MHHSYESLDGVGASGRAEGGIFRPLRDRDFRLLWIGATASLLGGTWFDNATAEPTNATAAQIAGEAVKAATHFGNTTQTPNLNDQYVIVSATGTHPDGFPNSGFCAYHNFTNSADGNASNTSSTDQTANATQTGGSSSCLSGCGGAGQAQAVDQSALTKQNADAEAAAGYVNFRLTPRYT